MNKYTSDETFLIEGNEVDYMGEYQLCHLFNRFSRIATKNASQIGFWNKDMINKYGWVVAKQSLHLDMPIYINDIIKLSTTIGNGKFASFPRFYFIEREHQQIGYCSSLWTLLDIQSRRITSPKKIGLPILTVEEDLTYQLPCQIDIDMLLEFNTIRRAAYSDIDTNQHMNNTRYIQWALDIIDFEIHNKYFISDLSIQYKKEIRPLEDVYLYMGQVKNRYIVEGRTKLDDVYFTIEIIFKKR